jgi:hypothetical protein
MPHAIRPMLNEGVRAFRVREDLGKGELNGVCLSQDASPLLFCGTCAFKVARNYLKMGVPLI